MKSRRAAALALSILILSSSVKASATTWAPVEVTCPVCHTKNTFLHIMSYGTYIYQWPSKYQLIFWPYTDSPVLYSCKKCHLTTYMFDYKDLPQTKIPALEKALQGVKLPAADEYTKIPMSERLLVAEKVYTLLERDDHFWGHFYRVMGYHYEEEKKQREADEARKKALGITERMLSNQENAGERKELLVISGAMRFFLKDNAGALKDFKEAVPLTYQKKGFKPEEAANVNKYLDMLLGQYIKIIEAGKTPSNEIALLESEPHQHNFLCQNRLRKPGGCADCGF